MFAFRLTFERVNEDESRTTVAINRTFSSPIKPAVKPSLWKPYVHRFPTTATDETSGEQYVLREEKSWNWPHWHITRIRIPAITEARRAQWASPAHLHNSRFGN